MEHRRIIPTNLQAPGPCPPRLKTIRPRRLSDYPHLPEVYRDVAQRLSSPLLAGPPICDELIALVQHLFTEEEAGVVRHLGLLTGRDAAALARDEHRPLDQIEPILDRLNREKRLIVSTGGGTTGKPCRYRLMPIVPGMFEMMLVSHTPESLTPWHRRFVELFEALFETGYAGDYADSIAPPVRYLPIEKSIEAQPMALPSDKLEVVFDRFDVFGIGQCQCRLAMQALGRGCGKPLANCMVMGEWATAGIETGSIRQVSKKEALAIKREAESHGLVNWMMNVDSVRGQCSCSCCGCCCHAMRTVSQLQAPGLIAPPHFLPRFDASRCTYCGRCAASCPMKAIVVDAQQKTYRHLPERCIGCGLCSLACEKQHALTMEPVPDYRLPYRSWFSLITRSAPGVLRTSWKLWRQRR